MAKSNGFELHEDEVIAIAVLGIIGFVIYKGGIANAAAAITGGIVNAAGSVVTGSVDGIGQAVGLPALADITTDPAVARYIIDQNSGGQFVASKYSSAAAYAKAQLMPAGSGVPPAPNTALATLFPPLVGPAYIPGLDSDPGDYMDWDQYSNPNLGL